MMQTIPLITIDGPSGSGKGTISRLVAGEVGYALLDSGAIYRLAALACIQERVDTENETSVAALAEQLDIRFDFSGESTTAFLNEIDVSRSIRDEQTGMMASKIAAYPAVRAALLNRQRQFRRAPGLVADGRDMGTVVFPDAQLKIFLTASAQERAVRRVKQLQLAGLEQIDEQQILADIQARDERDSNRAAAPLVPADDAIVLDSTSLSISEVYETVMREFKQRGL
ncbi:cytidylate kinase [Alteromonadaceae bacterium Bs31]|nr:cytidylate kinase [Alteromonadaceae bacterium Bs31]